jgi:Ni/Fe-hydrogenase subunit HybB-like protein
MSEDAATEAPRTDSQSGRDIDVDTVLASLQWGALLVFGILAVVAGAGVYSSLSTLIDIWVVERYQPIARAGFNLAVLCIAVTGIFALSRRL